MTGFRSSVSRFTTRGVSLRFEMSLFLAESSVSQVNLFFGYPRIFERGECHFNDLWLTDNIATYESNIAYVLRFMIDTKVCGDLIE